MKNNTLNLEICGEDIPPGCGLRRPAEGIVSGWKPDTVRNMRVLPVLLAIIACATLHAELLPPPVLERYEQMLVKTPEPGTAFDKVYQHYLESEGLEALAKHWSDAAEKNQAGRADYLLLLGLLNDQRGKTDDALKNLRAAAEGGQSWRAWSALASVEARAGKLAPAVEDYQKAIARNPPRDALVKMYRGLALGQQRLMDFAGAVETWQRCAKASPGDPFVLEEAGDALLEAGCFEEARTMFVQLREQKDADPARRLNASLRLAEVERQGGDKDAALKIYTEALAEAGAASWLQREVRERIERLFRRDDDLPGLAKYYQERLKVEPGDLEAALRLSETLAELNRNEESLKVLQAAAEKAPDNKDVQLKLAAMLLRAERPADAEAVLSALTKTFPDDGAVTVQLGEAQWQSFKLGKGSKEAALASWRKLAPEGAAANAVQHVAEIFRTHDLTDETLGEYRRALATDPAANDRREHLAEYLMALDRKGEAMTELQGLVADGRASGENYLRLAKIQRRFGDNAAALKSLAAAAAQFSDRAFERQHLAWQLVSEEKNWEEAEKLAAAMRGAAESGPEIECADECLVQAFQEQKKTAAEVRRLLDRHKESPDAFTERDWRLLFVLAVDGSDNGSAEFALAAGLRQFPKSAVLWKLEDALARRSGDPVRRIAALEQLQQIEPQRAGDWLAERVRVSRESERWDEAVALARQYVQAAPAKAGSHVLLADTLIAAQKQDEAIRALLEAIRLSDTPNPIRLRLADIYLSQGQFAPARAVVEEAFEAEENPAGKLQLTGRLANAYLQEGKIEVLIAKLRARQKAEEGGWRYALYLAEIYQMMQDSVHAMEELDKALAGKPDDPVLLKRLLNLAEMTGDTESALRYARKIAAVEPSKANRAQLGEALANDGKLDEVLGLLKDNSGEFLEDPPAWQQVVRVLQAEEKTGDLAALLEGSLRANPNDWRSLMVLAEILMGAGQTEKATALLWRVMAISGEKVVQPHPAAPPAAAPGLSGAPMAMVSPSRVFYTGGGVMTASQTRQTRFGATYQRAMQILASNPENVRIFALNAGMRYGGGRPPQAGNSTRDEARDEAIVYLACLAVRDGKEEGFLQKLSASVQKLSFEDRLSIAGMLQSPELTVREIEGYVVSGEKNPQATQAAFQSLQMVLGNRRNNAGIAGVPGADEKLKSLMEKLSVEMAANIQPENILQRYGLLILMGKQPEADKLADEILARPDSTDPVLLATAMQFAITRRNYDRALALHEKWKVARPKGGVAGQQYQSYALIMALIASDTHRAKGIDLLAEEFSATSPNLPNYAGFSPYASGARQQTAWPQLRGGNMANILPQPTRELSQQQVAMLRSFATHPQLTAAVPELIKRFGALAVSKNSATLRQATIWLLWFSGQQKEAEVAMKALIESHSADDLLLNYCMMLAEMKKPAEARNVLDRIRARSGDSYELATRLRFSLSLDAADQEAAKQAALNLAALRLVDYEQSQLGQEMKRLGLKDEADKLMKKTAASRNPGQRSRQMIEVMNERVESGNREEGLTLAYAMLGRDPLSRSGRNDRSQQEQALRTLKKFGELDTYIAKLKTRLEAAPQSARLNAQMAQAMQIKDPKLAEPYYRKLAELRPKDSEWLQQLGNLLLQSEQNEEAMRLFERILSENPARLFAQGTNFIEPYRRTKSWQRLVDAIAKSPDPKPDPLNPYQQNYSGVFMEIGRSVQRARPPVDPTEIWLKGLRWDQSGAVQLRPILAQSLIRAGRTDEARKVVEEAFFPPGRKEGPAGLFVYNRPFRPNAIWGQFSLRGNGEVESPALRLMRTAAALGFLQDLLPRFEKIAPPGDGSDPGLMARIVARDVTILPEIRKKIEEVKPGKPGLAPGTVGLSANGWRILADELANWPQARDLAPKVLQAAAQMITASGNDYNSLMGINLQLASLALEDNQIETAQKALKGWTQAQRDWQRQGAAMDFIAGLRVMKLMAAAGLDKEAAELRNALRADRNSSGNTHYQRMLTQTENEIAINSGHGGTVMAVLAWTPGAGGGGNLLWDLRPDGGAEDDDNRTVWMAQEPLRKISGRYTLDVYFGENQNAMKRLFTKSAVPARGSWSGKLPAGQGYLRAFLRLGEDVLMGPAVAAASGVSLLAPESLDEILKAKDGSAKGWSGIPPVPVSQEKGGPAGEGKFLRLDGDQQSQMELTAERIAIDPKKTYLAGCWFRYGQNAGSARFAWRIIDAAGKELGQYSANGTFNGDRWNYAVQRFGSEQRNAVDIPKDAAWLEPYLEFNGRCDLQGIFVTGVTGPGKEE